MRRLGRRGPRTGGRAAAIVLAGLLVVAGCDRGGSGGRSQPIVLHVAAASDLQGTLPELIERYQAATPGVTVVPMFGSSGQLAEQIKAGAPVDLFLAANEAYVRDLATEHYIREGSIRPYAIGTLVLAVRTDARVSIGSLADLALPSVKRVAIANPDVAPYGAAARQALKRAGLWEALGPKLVIAESVRQAYTYVQTGDAEAGLVGRSLTHGSNEVRTIAVDPSSHDPIVQSLGVVARTDQPEAAEAFARFLTGDEVRKRLASHGFQLPGGPWDGDDLKRGQAPGREGNDSGDSIRKARSQSPFEIVPLR